MNKTTKRNIIGSIICFFLSLLGAPQSTTETDFDNIPPVVGGYFITNTSTKQHAPFEESEARGLLEVFVNVSGYIVQRYTETNAVAYRNSTWLRSRNAGVWTQWQRIDNYGTTSLAGLASALGMRRFSQTLNIGDSIDISLIAFSLIMVCDRSTTGNIALFTVAYSAGDAAIHVISDPGSLIGNFFTISKPATGPSCVITSLKNNQLTGVTAIQSY